MNREYLAVGNLRTRMFDEILELDAVITDQALAVRKEQRTVPRLDEGADVRPLQPVIHGPTADRIAELERRNRRERLRRMHARPGPCEDRA